MPCSQTELLVSSFFDETGSSSQSVLHERHLYEEHLHTCIECQQALAAAQSVQAHLLQWREQPVPAWNRRAAMADAENAASRRSPVFSWWQWAPLAASLVLALAVVFNVRISTTGDGFVVAFGNQSQMSRADLELQLAQFEMQQTTSRAQEMAELTARLEERQDSNDARLMTTVIDRVVEQFEESSSRSLQQVMAYVDSQRQQDMQALQSSYQQLVDSDYQTIRSVQQLASYVQYQTE